jgi:hypothetical protein
VVVPLPLWAAHSYYRSQCNWCNWLVAVVMVRFRHIARSLYIVKAQS